MEEQQLQERIAEFPRWHYRFEFDGGVTTPVVDRGQLNRHEQRRNYFFMPLLRVLGGSLRGHRVLDLGCNAGFWSLNAIEAEADFVLGVDGRQMFIDQANLVFEAKGVDPARYRFEQGNIFAYEFNERFDVVLCLGIMEVTAKPVELFELMSHVGAKIVLIDTVVSRAASSFFEVSRLNDPRNRVEHEIVLLPSRDAVIELAQEFGFQVRPLAQNIVDYAGMDDYLHERRLAFICSKGISLQGLPRAPRPTRAPWWMSATQLKRAWRRMRSLGA